MTGLTTMIVDILRKKKENELMDRGGKVMPRDKGGLLPRAVEPKHGNETYDEIVTRMGRGG